MRYATVCSGIEAPSMAWHPLGWEPVWFSEIDRFPSAVLKHYYPDVPNLGDMTKIKQHETFKKSVGTIDLFCGGTPCQSFSVAGLRKGMDDPRGNLALVFLGIVDQLRPRWVVWENVPGILSSNRGRDFGAFLGALGQLGYGWSYRILDAQYFGVPQRRRRVFVVGHIGGWQRAAAVLFERHSLQGHLAPRRETGKGFAADVAPSLTASGRGVERTGESRGQDPVIAIQERAVSKNIENGPGGKGFRTGTAYTIEARTTAQYVAYKMQETTGALCAGTYKSMSDQQAQQGQFIPVAFTQNTRDEVRYIGGDGQVTGALAANIKSMQVRRLTPRECERLQGFPDNYTRIPYRGKPAKDCPDGPRYKAIGNSMAVPVMRWIGERIQKVDSI